MAKVSNSHKGNVKPAPKDKAISPSKKPCCPATNPGKVSQKKRDK